MNRASSFSMRVFSFLFLSLSATIGFGKVMPSLPVSSFADTEVSACYQFDQTGVGTLDFSLAFIGTPSNHVEVAFGTDLDGDCELSPQETDLVLGWSCGHYFIERFATGERVETAALAGGELNWRYELSKNRTILTAFTMTNEAEPLFPELSDARPDWLYDPDWDLLRLTARGLDAPDECFAMDLQFKGSSILFR